METGDLKVVNHHSSLPYTPPAKLEEKSEEEVVKVLAPPCLPCLDMLLGGPPAKLQEVTMPSLTSTVAAATTMKRAHKGTQKDITIEEVEAAQKKWGDGLIKVGTCDAA